VTSFHENLSGPPTGEVTLLLSVLGHLLTSPKDVGGIGVFTQTPGSAPAATFVKVGSAFARDRSYPVSSVEL